MNFLILFAAVCIPWVLSEVILLFLARSKRDNSDRDEGSIVWLNATIYTCVAIGVCTGFFGIGYVRVGGIVIPWIGLCFIIIGIVIRWIAILTLRKYFTTNVVIQSDHRIIKSGIYKFVRHPSYSGSIVSFCGLGFALCNWISLIVLVVPITIAFAKRIKVEECALEGAFGEEYVQYRKSSWYLFPGIF